MYAATLVNKSWDYLSSMINVKKKLSPFERAQAQHLVTKQQFLCWQLSRELHQHLNSQQILHLSPGIQGRMNLL